MRRRWSTEVGMMDLVKSLLPCYTDTAALKTSEGW